MPDTVQDDPCTADLQHEDKSGDIIYFHNKSHENTKSSIEFFLLLLFFCAVDLHCCPNTIKNTSVSHSVALGEFPSMNMDTVV